MRVVKKIIAVMLYLLLISFLFQFQLWKLFDFRQMAVVVFGTIMLYLPGSQIQKQKEINLQVLGNCSIYAAMIQSFILLFILFTSLKGTNVLLEGVALNCRPLLYGICIWSVCQLAGERQSQREHQIEHQIEQKEAENLSTQSTGRNLDREEYTASEAYDRFLLLGLSKREAEVAMQVAKGLSNGEIAAELYISEATVKKHITNIFQKLNIEKREQIKERLHEK